MGDITAAMVMKLREETGLPMMECKKALQENGGDMDVAKKWLREHGIKTQSTRMDRATECGRIAVYVNPDKNVGAMIEILCESPPVAGSPEFRDFANAIAKQLATGPGAASPDELLKQPSPMKPGQTISEQKDDMFNRIREVFNLSRILRINGRCGGYAHHDGSSAALVEVTGGPAELAKEVAMRVVAQGPAVVNKEQLDPALVENEREILSAAARKEGKPENIIAKMVEGRLRNFFAERVLVEQPFVKDDSQSVGKLAAAANMQILMFVRWKLGKPE